MSDFLVSFSDKYTGKHLLELLKVPYGKYAPKGRSFDFPSNSIVVLVERFSFNKNIVEAERAILAWIRDLIRGTSQKLQIASIDRLTGLKSCGPLSGLAVRSWKLVETVERGRIKKQLVHRKREICKRGA